jgi:hypothetical protein
VTEVKEAVSSEHRRQRSLDLHQALELARDRGEQRPERFAVGQKVDARIIQFDRRAHKVQVSIKALEVAEEKEAIANTAPPIPARRSATSSAPRSSGQPKSLPRKRNRQGPSRSSLGWRRCR